MAVFSMPTDFATKVLVIQLPNETKFKLRRSGQREIHFAAATEWPHTDPANFGIRVEFQLPSDRVMK